MIPILLDAIEGPAVRVALEREFAARMQAKTTELAAGHLSLLSQPEAVAKVILEAVASVA